MAEFPRFNLSDTLSLAGGGSTSFMTWYNDFDIILDHFPRVFQLHPTPHALWSVFYLVPSLT